MSQEKTALILFAHGSRDPEWANTLQSVVGRVSAKAPDILLAIAFLELMSPSLKESCEVLVAQGATKIVVLPMFMAQGGHLKQDLPEQISAIQPLFPNVTIEQVGAVGQADIVLEAMAQHVLSLTSVQSS